MALSEFVYKRRVEYRETDASGLVHFTVFFAYAEEAEHAMWRAAGVSVEPSDTARVGKRRLRVDFSSNPSPPWRSSSSPRGPGHGDAARI